MRKSSLLFVFVLSGLFAANASGQTSITASDFLGLIGQSHTITEESAFPGTIAVNVGSSGASQTWDFTSITLSGDSYSRSFVDPGDTPYAAMFPTANFVFQSTIVEDTVTASGYQYNFVDNSALTELGFVFEYADSTIFEIETEPTVINLPVTMGSTWTDVSRDTTGFGAFGVIFIDSTVTMADAWGTATLGIGTVDVLRLRGNETSITATYSSGMLVQADTTTYITYEWVSPDYFIVASISSAEDEEDPNFTVAEYVQLLTGLTTGVHDPVAPNQVSMFRSLYPNPTSGSVSVEFDASAPFVDIAVYDILGRQVRQLDAPEFAGPRTISWDGNTENGERAAEGIYLIRLRSDQRTETRRVVVTR